MSGADQNFATNEFGQVEFPPEFEQNVEEPFEVDDLGNPLQQQKLSDDLISKVYNDENMDRLN